MYNYSRYKEIKEGYISIFREYNLMRYKSPSINSGKSNR